MRTRQVRVYAAQVSERGGLVTPAASRRQRASPAPVEPERRQPPLSGRENGAQLPRAVGAGKTRRLQEREKQPRTPQQQCKTGRRWRVNCGSELLRGNGTHGRRQITAGQLTRARAHCQASTGGQPRQERIKHPITTDGDVHAHGGGTRAEGGARATSAKAFDRE